MLKNAVVNLSKMPNLLFSIGKQMKKTISWPKKRHRSSSSDIFRYRSSKNGVDKIWGAGWIVPTCALCCRHIRICCLLIPGGDLHF